MLRSSAVLVLLVVSGCLALSGRRDVNTLLSHARELEQPQFEPSPDTQTADFEYGTGKVAQISFRVHAPTGASSGQPKFAVLVHGIVDWSYRWDGFVAGLQGQGYTVVRYDHLSRGFSSVVPLDVKMDSSFYLRELDAVMDAAEVGGSIDVLIGHSMGGAISVTYAGQPESAKRKVERLVLLAPAGFFRSFGVDWFMMKIASLPSKGILLSAMRNSFFENSDKEIAKDFMNPDEKSNNVYANFKLQQQLMVANRPHCVDAFIASIHDFKELLNARKHATSVAKLGIPTLAMFGKGDLVVNSEHAKSNIEAAFEKVKRSHLLTTEMVLDSRHCFHIEREDVVLPQVLEFLVRGVISD